MEPSQSQPVLGTRDALLESAAACFAKYGYEATSIRLVASLAGENSSLIAYYFGGKEGLYRQVIEELFYRSTAKMHCERSPIHDVNTLKYRLHTIVQKMLEDINSTISNSNINHQIIRKLWLSELNSPKPEIKDLIQKHMENDIVELKQLLQSFHPDMSAQDIAFWGILIQGCCLSHALLAEVGQILWPEFVIAPDVDEAATRLTNFMYNGLICL